ncbi:hypothetical protein H0H87_012180 [Tephrocybe sp. NHM501043]|nr:hypothetical protein H0H87_012180 [Tephrocybe sp. NHM501043]
MFSSFFSSPHKEACVRKQVERQATLDALSPDCSTPLSLSERKIHALSLSQLVAGCKAGEINPADVMAAYTKKAVAAQAATNCLTDLMFDEALRIPAVANGPHNTDLDAFDSVRDRSLLGVPVSIKDTVDFAGHDTTIGFSRNTNNPVSSSSAIVRLLQDNGALVHAKTTVPTGLLGLETSSEVFGRTSNPYKATHTAGASTGGGAALVACGGSKIEIGSDLAGSVRIPAHFCGIWSLKGSVGRFPSWGNHSSMEGLEGIQLVTSPMASSLEDLDEFWKRVVMAKPWEYDHTCHPIPWRDVDLREDGRKLKWGIMLEGGAVPITPACKRALSMVAAALRKQGHEVVEFVPPNMERGLNIAYQLLFSDGGEQIRSLLSLNENVSKASSSVLDLLSLPKSFKQFLAYLTRKSDPASATLLRIMHPKTVTELRTLTAQRETYRAEWHESWREKGLDFVLTVPHPFPAFRHGESEKVNLMTAAFTTIFSLLDYTAGVIPVTFVNKELDCLPADFKVDSPLGTLAYSVYDVNDMHGLPLGVQIVGRRLEEERVLEDEPHAGSAPTTPTQLIRLRMQVEKPASLCHAKDIGMVTEQVRDEEPGVGQGQVMASIPMP